MKVCTLASGSKGNCIYIEGGGAKVLIDAGLTLRELRLRLSRIDVSIDELSAVVITHEHIDHVKGVGPLARACGVPVYLTPLTRKAASGWLGKGVVIREFEAGEPFEVMGLSVEPFSIPHDAADPVGFTFRSNGFKAGFATDLGYATKLVTERLRGSNLLIIESNHDPEMLKTGPYPLHLQQRVAGKEGHLSNDDAGTLLEELLHDGLRHVILAHLSQINNLPELAHGRAREALKNRPMNGSATFLGEVGLSVAFQDEVSEVVEL